MQIEGRAADDLEHVARGGLVFERFLEVVSALAQFAEQPRVLDSDDRLIGERRCQRDLFIGEPFDAGSVQNDDAKQRIVPEQRHSQTRAQIAPLLRFRKSVFGIGGGVVDMHDPPFECYPPRERASIRHKWVCDHEFSELRVDATRRDQMVASFVPSEHVPMVGLA